MRSPNRMQIGGMAARIDTWIQYFDGSIDRRISTWQLRRGNMQSTEPSVMLAGSVNTMVAIPPNSSMPPIKAIERAEIFRLAVFGSASLIFRRAQMATIVDKTKLERTKIINVALTPELSRPARGEPVLLGATKRARLERIVRPHLCA